MAVPYARAGNDRCAVRALRAWLEAAGIHRGPVFRRMRRGDTLSDRAAHRPVGRADYQAPCESRGTRARAALRTFAPRRVCDGGRHRRRRGAEDRQRHPHKDLPVLRRYIRAATAFDDVGEVL